MNRSLVTDGIETRWKPGQSGNRRGRPAGFAKLAKLIRQETRDGEELVEFALSVMRGERFTVGVYKGVVYKMAPKLELRIEAMKWLADRGFGKMRLRLATVFVTRNATGLRGRLLSDERTNQHRNVLENLSVL